MDDLLNVDSNKRLIGGLMVHVTNPVPCIISMMTARMITVHFVVVLVFQILPLFYHCTSIVSRHHNDKYILWDRGCGISSRSFLSDVM